MSQADAIAAALTAEVEKATKTLVLEIAANLIEATPVDTGWARANWIPSIGAPVAEPDGDRTGVSTSVQEQGQAKVLGYKLDAGACFVSNNVPYIQLLDLGHSRQAPAGFVAIAIDQAFQTVQERFSNVDLGSFRDEAGGAAAENLASAYSPFGAP